MSKNPSEKTPPSILGVYFYATLMALFGAVLGFVYMATFPGQAFSSKADYEASLAESEESVSAPKPGDTYYIEGNVSGTRSWEPKRLQLAAEGAQSVRLSEGEINSWMTTKFRPGAIPSGEEAAGLMIVPGVPNFAITDEGIVYLNLATAISAYGAKGNFIISARCTLDASGEVRFKSVNVSSAKVPLPGILGRQIYQTLAKGFKETEEYAIISEAFARADSIEIEGSELIFNLR
jgi:hypothetical protein